MAIDLMRNVVIFAWLCGIANSLMPLVPVFENFVKGRCYNKTSNDKYLINGQRIPLSSSMETFISLLESFETNYTQYEPSDVAEKFLRRFRIDNVVRKLDAQQRDYTFESDDNENSRTMLTEAILFGTRGHTYLFPEEAFTEEEKCALYYMMSHTFVNCTADDRLTAESQENRCFIEQGVASLYNNDMHAIAPARVLLGILAGLKNLKERTIKEVLDAMPFIKTPFGENIDDHLNEIIDPIYAVTVGDVVAEEIRRVETQENSRKFGPNGDWNTTNCPTRYYLKSTEKPTKATYSELRGAGDGLLLGLLAKELTLSNQKFTISSLLRMYYSQHGIQLPGTGIKYNYCQRYTRWFAIDSDISRQILSYVKLLSITKPILANKGINFDDQVKQAMSEFENSRRHIVDIVDRERCDEYENCEKQADVFVVMDTRGNEADVEIKQEKIISYLAERLDMRLYGGSMTVMSLSRGYGDRQLENIVYNSTSKGCIDCLLDWVVPQGREENEAYIFQSINKTLMNFEKEKEQLPGVPGKVVLYFNYADSPPRNDRDLKNALWEVKNKHRDVPIFAVGKSKDLLKMFATDDDKALMTEDRITMALNEKICKTFSTFQYPHCRERKSSLEDSVFRGYITPSYTQYWAMYPEYFLKSYNIKFTFTAENGKVKVCHSRDSREEILDKNCVETSSNDKERPAKFTMSNPCKKQNVYNCRPFYFLIKGLEVDSNKANLCTEKECRSIDQIKFTVRHEGVSCNSSSSLISSLQIVIALLVLFCMAKKNI